jgi:hypothetical protein
MPQVSAVLRHDDVTDLPEFRSHGTDKKFAELAMEDLQAAVRQGIIDFLDAVAAVLLNAFHATAGVHLKSTLSRRSSSQVPSSIGRLSMSTRSYQPRTKMV